MKCVLLDLLSRSSDSIAEENVGSGGLKFIKAAGLMMLFVSTQFYSLSAAPVPQDHQQMRPSVPHGTVRHFVYTTTVAKNLPFAREDYYVYTPPGYDPAAKTKYPVLYLLHGYEQGASAWIKSGRANLALDELIAMGKARPMIVVMPRCYGDNKFLLGGFLVWGFPEKVEANVGLFSKMLLTEIMPRVESDYRVSKKHSDRAIVGLSMGGLEALTIGLENPRKFDWIGGFSSAVPKETSDSLMALLPEGSDFKLIWIAYGVSDMHFIVNGDTRLVSSLKKRGFPVTAIETPGRHEWPVWRYNFNQFVPLLFQPQ
jgi:enterochelin esterase-like enzyme